MLYFQYALARELGMTRGALVEQITFEEIMEWSRFFEIEARQLREQAKTPPKKAAPPRRK